MPTGTGLDASLMFGKETTFGTVASFTRGVEFKSETIKRGKAIVEGEGLRAGGRVKRVQRRVITTRDAKGAVNFEFVNSFLGLIHQQVFGVATSAAGTSTTLGASAAAGATTVTLAAAAALGDALWIDSGGAAPELRFVIGNPGTTPSIAPLTSAHASGVTVLVNGGPSNFLQTFTLGGLVGQSLSAQLGTPSSSGTIEPFTYVGLKIPDYEVTIDKAGIGQVTMNVDARDEQTLGSTPAGPTLTTPVYNAAAGVFSFLGASLALGGSLIGNVTKASWKVTRPMKTDRFFLGQGGLKGEQLENGWATVTGQFDAEFFTRTALFDAFAADTNLSTVITYGGTALANSVPSSAAVVMPNLRLNGDSPDVSGPDVVAISAPYEALDDGTTAPITLKVVTADTTL